MCYNVNAKAKPEQLKVRYNANIVPEQMKLFNHVSGYDHPYLPILTSHNSTEFSFCKWGLIPFWTKGLEAAKKIAQGTLNAKMETLFELPSYRSIVRKNRCIIPVTGFFEPHDFGGKKYPFFIKLKNLEIFSLAGVYDRWKNPEGKSVETFSIITTVPNAILARIHNKKERMPVILTPELEKAWLAQELSDKTINDVLQPCAEELIAAWPVSNHIYKWKEKTNLDESTVKVNYPELQNDPLVKDLI
jgi:putative SOS response-associated peptidase YedK